MNSPKIEMEAKDNAILPIPPPPPAEPALRTEIREEKFTTKNSGIEEDDFEEIASEEIVAIDLPNEEEDNSSNQGSEVVEQEENLPEVFMPDETPPNNVMDEEVLPAVTYRMSEKNSLSIEGMADSYAQVSVYDWSSAFANDQFQEITKRFEEADWAEQHTNEEAMFFAARAYHALGKLNKARKIMEEVADLNEDKVEEAQDFLKEWKE